MSEMAQNSSKVRHTDGDGDEAAVHEGDEAQEHPGGGPTRDRLEAGA